MKKIMITLATATIAVALNASTVSWSCLSGRIYDGAATPAYVAEGTSAYLVFVSEMSQAEAVASFKSDSSGSGVKAKAATTAGEINSAARIDYTDSTFALTGDAAAYFVIFAGGNMYVSSDATASYDGLGDTADLSFTSQSTSSKVMNDLTGGYSGAGWYAGAVPEPTSGLLLLLGVAGLALKRKQA